VNDIWLRIIYTHVLGPETLRLRTRQQYRSIIFQHTVLSPKRGEELITACGNVSNTHRAFKPDGHGHLRNLNTFMRNQVNDDLVIFLGSLVCIICCIHLTRSYYAEGHLFSAYIQLYIGILKTIRLHAEECHSTL
jgi:hypothetical protein